VRFVRKIAGMFMADRLVMLAVPVAACFGWLGAHYLPRPLVAFALLVVLAAAFSTGVLRAARRSDAG